MENASVFVARLAAVALTSAIFCAGAVFFVVDQSLRGMEAAIEQSSKRVDDLKSDLNRFEDATLAAFAALQSDFRDQNQKIEQQLRDIQDTLKQVERVEREAENNMLAIEEMESQFAALISKQENSSNTDPADLRFAAELVALIEVIQEMNPGSTATQRRLETLEASARKNCEILAEAQGFEPSCPPPS